MNMEHLLAECELTRRLNKAYNIPWIIKLYVKSNYVKHHPKIIEYLQKFNKIQLYK